MGVQHQCTMVRQRQPPFSRGNQHWFTLLHQCKLHSYPLHHLPRDGNKVGQVRRMGSSSPPCMILSYPISTPHDEENFLASWGPLGAPQSSTPPHKTLLLVNLPTTIAIVFNKTCFVNKNYLKLKINLSHQIKLIFSKN